MPVFEDRFQVKASLEAVSFFHQDIRALKWLTPPPVIVQIKRVEPVAEGSRSAFRLWFGPLPVDWLAVHSQVDAMRGFTDTQVNGIMKQWVHTHQWRAIDAVTTEITEHVEY